MEDGISWGEAIALVLILGPVLWFMCSILFEKPGSTD